MSVLKIRHVQRAFGDRTVVDGLTLTLDVGHKMALIGPNGSGKSTILRCVAGIVTPDSGSIMVDGHAAGSLAARKKVGASFAQERAFYLRLSGRENLLIFGRLRHRRERDAAGQVDDLIEELGIGHFVHQRADRCSSGMLLQLAFARSLLGDPRLLLLDEPTRSLDEKATETLWRALEQRAEIAVLMATHLESDAARCDERLILGPRAS